ncbi:hypothetical protein L3Q82_016364, partial [Scortum barcoo]
IQLLLSFCQSSSDWFRSQTGSGLQRVSDWFRSQTGSGLVSQRVSGWFRSTESLRLVQVSDWFRSQTGSGPQRVSGWFRSTESLRLVQVYRESQRLVQVSGWFRSTESLRLVQVYRESQAGSGLRTGSGPQRVSGWFRSTESLSWFRSQAGSGLRLVQVYRESQDWFRSQAGSGPQRVSGWFRSQAGSGLQRVSEAGSGLRLVQVSGWFRSTESLRLVQVSDWFRSTESLRLVQVYRESQTGSGLQRVSGGSGLRLVQVYRELLLMKMMMKMLVLVLVLVLVFSGVSADSSHRDFHIIGCSESDGEDMYSLDGEEMWYADFKQGKGVEPQPSFVDHFSYVEGTYQGAVANQQICKQNLKIEREALKNVPLENDAPSSLIVYSRDDVELGQANKLICHVSGFYPAPVQIVWKKNEKNVTEGTSFNVPFPNKDGSFSQFSSLEFSPEQGDVYSCSVTHLTLTQAMTRFWTVEKTEPGIGPAVFCGLGLTVGLLGVAAGTFFLIKGNECS